MRAPSIIIIASPYEAELLGRELSDTGLRVLRADGGDGALALLATELPIAIVVGTTLLGADPSAVVAEARARHESVSLFLLADVEDPIGDELRPRVTAIFRRPTDFDALASAIEGVAVEVERVDLAEVDALAPPAPSPEAPSAIRRIPTQPFGDLVPVPDQPLVRAHRTEVLSEPGNIVSPVATAPPVAHRNGGSAEALHVDERAATLLRADETLGDLGMSLDEMTAPPRPKLKARAFENRSTIAREIDRELSQAERRLFPNESSSSTPFDDRDDYDDALSDIDLDSLAIDTIPGLAQSLGIDERPRARTREREPLPLPTIALAEAPPLRPVQEEGDLTESDIAELLARLHLNGYSGALHIKLPEGDKILYLDHGEPVGASSTLRHDQLAEMLFREGKLTRDQAQKVRSAATPDGSPRVVALRLVEQGLLKEREVFAVMRRHAEEVLFSLFGLVAGGYELRPTLPAADDRVRLSASTWALLLEGVRRKYGLERLGARLGGRELVLRPTTSFARVVEAATLSSDERRLVALLDGVRSLGEIRAAIGGRVAESVVFAIAWLLRIAGAAETGVGVTDVRYASTVVTGADVGERRTRPRVDDSAQAAAEEAVEHERIASKRAQIIDADYFAILGVGRDASEHELRRAHERLCTDFDPTRFAPETATRHREALLEIREVLDEAARVLLQRSVREGYAAHLPAAASPSDESDAT